MSFACSSSSLKARDKFFKEVEPLLTDWCMSVDGDTASYVEDKGVVYDCCAWGEKTLGAGETPEDAHAELKKSNPTFKWATKWLCLEYLEWDEEIYD